MFTTVHNTHLPQFMCPVPEPRAQAIDALSQDWQGRSMHMFPPFPLLNKVIQKLRTSGGHHNHGFHIYYICVWTTHASFRSAETCCHNRVISRVASCTICTHLEALMQHYLAAGFSKEVSKLTAALRRPSTNRMTGGYASLTGPQGKDLIHLVPQLLK